MNNQNVAYLRVSSIDQSLSRQQEAMKTVDLDRVFEEKASAKDCHRPKLKACIDYCRTADMLHVHSIDRIARNLKDLQNIIDQLVDKGVSIRFHKEGMIFNGNDDAINRLTLQMMGAFAEFERSLIRERQREGLDAARKKGKKFGRKKVLSARQIVEIEAKLASGYSKTSIAKEYHISRTTLYTALMKKA